MIKKILISENEFIDTNYNRLKNLLIDSKANAHLTVDYLIEINNIITGMR